MAFVHPLRCSRPVPRSHRPATSSSGPWRVRLPLHGRAQARAPHSRPSPLRRPSSGRPFLRPGPLPVPLGPRSALATVTICREVVFTARPPQVRTRGHIPGPRVPCGTGTLGSTRSTTESVNRAAGCSPSDADTFRSLTNYQTCGTANPCAGAEGAGAKRPALTPSGPGLGGRRRPPVRSALSAGASSSARPRPNSPSSPHAFPAQNHLPPPTLRPRPSRLSLRGPCGAHRSEPQPHRPLPAASPLPCSVAPKHQSPGLTSCHVPARRPNTHLAQPLVSCSPLSPCLQPLVTAQVTSSGGNLPSAPQGSSPAPHGALDSFTLLLSISLHPTGHVLYLFPA